MHYAGHLKKGTKGLEYKFSQKKKISKSNLNNYDKICTGK